jgi:hypothetical protein
MPGAISGAGGHDATFAVACKLVEFGLSPDDAWRLLLEYNQRCHPQWSERELRHKLEDAFRRTNPRMILIPAPYATDLTANPKRKLIPQTPLKILSKVSVAPPAT